MEGENGLHTNTDTWTLQIYEKIKSCHFQQNGIRAEGVVVNEISQRKSQMPRVLSYAEAQNSQMKTSHTWRLGKLDGGN